MWNLILASPFTYIGLAGLFIVMFMFGPGLWLAQQLGRTLIVLRNWVYSTHKTRLYLERYQYQPLHLLEA